MPRWDGVERHTIELTASAEQAWPVVRAMDFRRSLVVRSLMALRSVPALFSRETHGGEALGCDVDGLLRSGFVLLEERAGEEVILGLVGRFWTPSGGVQRVTPDEFRAWTRPGFARAVWNFALTQHADGRTCTLATETRVLCTDAASRSSFLRYWRVIGPFSALIRRVMLRSVRDTVASA
jgi:hypothetical protein